MNPHLTYYTWHDGTRCREPATHYLFTPAGEKCPGGWTCEPHGRATVDEYREKLDQCWTLRPIA
jgi:hypothetical protein